MESISILSIGSELLDGRVADTNCNFLCTELSNRGLVVKGTQSCGDDIDDIVSALEFLSERSTTVIISGGLGPTTDDLTREAVAKFCGKALSQDNAALEMIKAAFKRRKREFPASNEKQSFFPDGAAIINNPVGTAPGFVIEHKKVHIFSLPGVPSELRAMFAESVLPAICERAKGSRIIRTAAIKLFGVPESAAGIRIVEVNLPSNVSVSYRAAFPEIHILLKCSDESLDLAYWKEKCVAAVGSENVFSRSLDESFESSINKLLISKNLTVTTAESCTGGMAAQMLTASPGASAYFLASFVTYSNQAKKNLLGVDEVLLTSKGAVSGETARAMAAGCRKAAGADIALSITGIAGPDGGTLEKPVGLFYVGLSSAEADRSFCYFMPSVRKAIRRYASYMALDILRRYLLDLPFIPQYEPDQQRR
ncbi:MAG: competence/damage-inducible protein A [Deltaproteobacteria bacterium]|nr:competence/damage-inducible protein A [Deltaproteobacteria bacterium]